MTSNLYREEGSVFVDYCSFTMEPMKGAGSSQRMDIAFWAIKSFFNDISIETHLHHRDRGIFGFYASADIQCEGVNLGIIASGGNNGRTYVSITGLGCSLMNMRKLADFIRKENCRISRIDLAYDDFKGKKTVHDCRQAYRDGHFTNRGQVPNSEAVGPWDNQEAWGKGLTYYVGKRQNGKMLRVYEKGKQLGDPTSQWVRHEVELRRVGKFNLSPDMLVDTYRYFVGAYENWLDFVPVNKVKKAVRIKKEIQCTVQHLQRYARQSYGAFINVMKSLGDSPDDIVRKLIRKDEIPKRLKSTALQASFA
jgi:phage replication initiation protein